MLRFARAIRRSKTDAKICICDSARDLRCTAWSESAPTLSQGPIGQQAQFMESSGAEKEWRHQYMLWDRDGVFDKIGRASYATERRFQRNLFTGVPLCAYEREWTSIEHLICATRLLRDGSGAVECKVSWILRVPYCVGLAFTREFLLPTASFIPL